MTRILETVVQFNPVVCSRCIDQRRSDARKIFRKERTAITTALLVVVVVAGGAVVATTGETAAVAAGVGALGSKVDLDLATLELLIVELLDGSIGLALVREGDETEATGAAY